MGYSYTPSGSLCCDVCTAAGAKKRPCPFGYCKPIAACADCFTKNMAEMFSAARHEGHGCKAGHEDHLKTEATKQQILERGGWLRCSAINQPNGVHVTFRNRRGDTQVYRMTKRTYRMIPLLTPVTPLHYEFYGRITRVLA